MKDKKISRKLLWGNYYGYMVTGIAALITGAILPFLMKEFNLGFDGGGSLIALQAMGNLGASLLGGIISDYTGRKPVLLIGALFFVISFGGIFFISSSKLLFLLIFIAGLGWGVMSSIVNSLLSDVSGGRADIMNYLHMFFAIGAFSAPFIVGLFVRLNISWRYSLLILALMSIVLFFIFLFMPIPKHGKSKTELETKTNSPFKNIRYYIFMFMLFLYVGSENNINGWIVSYLDNLELHSRLEPQDFLSIFWIAIIFGRIAGATISKYLKREKLLLLFASLGSAAFLFFLLSSTPILLGISIFIVGFALAGIYPTVIANSSPIIEGSGTATGIMLSLGGLGGAVFPYINGLIAETRGLYAGMVFIMFASLLLVIAALVNIRLAKS